MNVTYKRVTQVVMAGAVSLIVGTGADAATVGAVWDPPFGGPLGSMYWTGQGNFLIDDGCLASAPMTGASLSYASSCPMTFQGATVTLYNVQGDPSNRSEYTFIAPDVNVVDMKLATIDGKPAVVGIDTSLVLNGYEFPSLTVGVPFYSGALWLQWINSVPDPVLGYVDRSESCFQNSSNDAACSPYRFPPSAPALLNVIETNCPGVNCVRVSEVPEPGTMGLLFGGLGAGWFARRRKKTA